MANAADLPNSDAPPASGNRPIPLRVEYTRINSFFADYTRNISKGSTFVKTDRPLGVGTRFLFVFCFPDLPLPIPQTVTKRAHESEDPRVLPLIGVVRWVTTVKQAGTDKPPGMGIEYLFGDDTERSEIRIWVVALMKHVLGDHLAAKLLTESP